MTGSCNNAPTPGGRRRARDKVFPVLSLLMGVMCAWASWDLAGRVREYNSSRAVGALITSGMMGARQQEAAAGTASAPAVNERTGLPWISFPNPAGPSVDTMPAREHGDVIPDAPAPLSVSELTRASSFAETVVYVWERVQYGLAVLLGLVGLVGLFTGWVRGPHLLAAGATLAATAATLVGMRVLVDPEGGAFHPLPLTSYLLAGLGQSLYGLVLLGAFARKNAPGSRRDGSVC